MSWDKGGHRGKHLQKDEEDGAGGGWVEEEEEEEQRDSDRDSESERARERERDARTHTPPPPLQRERERERERERAGQTHMPPLSLLVGEWAEPKEMVESYTRTYGVPVFARMTSPCLGEQRMLYADVC